MSTSMRVSGGGADVATTDAISASTLEHVLGTGDISKLTVPQRVEFYRAACKSLGLNPLTRPIRFLSFQGQMQAYFTRDGTDQLRKNNQITLRVVDKHIDGDVYVVTVRARTPDGREDEDIGAVTLGRLQSDSRANALMKCVTKAKRRVTLSICGLGWASEDELDTMPGAQTFDAEEEPPVPPVRARSVEPPVESTPSRLTPEQWLDSLALALRDAHTPEAINAILDSPRVLQARQRAAGAIKQRLDAMVAEAAARAAPKPDEPWEDPIEPLLAEIEAMDATDLERSTTSAEWRAKVRAAASFPPDEDRVREAIEARKQALRGANG